ncbi:hypothetical protein AB4Z17_29630, partial [Paenibacillus sp. TAF43_2]|uniref:hypothetical protein n=1 Tax=Paenibacillus sp. TAF43_2 TaxID=3233069 RepID=UPI003F9632C5
DSINKRLFELIKQYLDCGLTVAEASDKTSQVLKSDYKQDLSPGGVLSRYYKIIKILEMNNNPANNLETQLSKHTINENINKRLLELMKQEINKGVNVSTAAEKTAIDLKNEFNLSLSSQGVLTRYYKIIKDEARDKKIKKEVHDIEEINIGGFSDENFLGDIHNLQKVISERNETIRQQEIKINELKHVVIELNQQIIELREKDNHREAVLSKAQTIIADILKKSPQQL